jgi:hypothetical protein
MLQLVACKRDFPRVAQQVGSRKPELLALEKPEETGKSHVSPHLHRRGERIGFSWHRQDIPCMTPYAQIDIGVTIQALVARSSEV